ncbi:MAG: hypothetical protein ACK2TX_08505 [Anaerolineales bacterium]
MRAPRAIHHRLKWVSLAIWLIACAGYVFFSSRLAGTGFPLDDAWIHQTYARNLVQGHYWGFAPGSPSAGSTSPLWTGIIAVGYFLHVHPKIWTMLMGMLAQLNLAFVCSTWIRQRNPGNEKIGIWVFTLVLLEWHLIWAALSGMEILLYALLVCGLFLLLGMPSLRPIWAGALVGAGVWIRPDALLLLLPAAWVCLFRPKHRTAARFLDLAGLMVGAAVIFLPYLGFNRLLDGSFWPSTYYAKQAEYAVMLEAPLLRRLGEQFAQPLTGLGLLLVPGVIWGVYRDMKQRAWTRLAPLLWVLAFAGAYAIRLPVVYQHGRYAMPMIPIFVVLGMEGLLDLHKHLAKRTWTGMLSRTWSVSIVAVGLVFLLPGGRAYGMDVAVIETEMVQTARWIAVHTERNALVAAHDIGALGYYGERPILDLAGLISPEVIPVIRDEAALARMLDERGAKYLMTFPGWYPELTEGLIPVYVSGGVYSPALGGENMSVYRWKP